MHSVSGFLEVFKMATEKNIENELKQRLDALQKRYEHEQEQLKFRFDREKRMLEERYKHMLKAFEKKPTH